MSDVFMIFKWDPIWMNSPGWAQNMVWLGWRPLRWLPLWSAMPTWSVRWWRVADGLGPWLGPGISDRSRAFCDSRDLSSWLFFWRCWCWQTWPQLLVPLEPQLLLRISFFKPYSSFLLWRLEIHSAGRHKHSFHRFLQHFVKDRSAGLWAASPFGPYEGS